MTQTGHAAPTVLPVLARPWAALIAALAALATRLYLWAGSVLLSPYAPRRVLDALVSGFWLAVTAAILVLAFVGSVQ